MGRNTYSTYEAKAHLSEILRNIRRTRRVLITSNGKPVAELRPFSAHGETPGDRVSRLQDLGIVDHRARSAKAAFPRAEKKPGALHRFLEERE